MSITDYGKIVQKRDDDEIHSTNAKKNYYNTYKEGQQRIHRTMNNWIKQK